jgi:hypothetical protein
MFRPGEIEDLRAISEAWGVPVATVVWATFADRLARCRHRAPELGKHGLAITVGLTVTRLATERHARRGSKRRAVAARLVAAGSDQEPERTRSSERAAE